MALQGESAHLRIPKQMHLYAPNPFIWMEIGLMLLFAIILEFTGQRRRKREEKSESYADKLLLEPRCFVTPSVVPMAIPMSSGLSSVCL